MNSTILSAVALLSMPGGVRAVEWKEVVRAIGIVESQMLHSSVGDGGASRGAWQICRAAWSDVDKVRRSQKRKTYPWRTGAHDPSVAFAYAKDLLLILNRRLAHDLGRPPTVQELYAAYNLGLKGFEARKFRLDNCPKVTRNGAEEVVNLCGK
jgi:glycine/D-amino acid oxidase-like deaminating enzyme